MSTKGSLKIKSIKIKDLPQTDLEESYPQVYVSVQLNKNIRKTSDKTSRNPSFHEVLEFNEVNFSSSSDLVFTVIDKHADGREETLGTVTSSLQSLTSANGPITSTLQQGKKNSKQSSKLTFEFECHEPKVQEKKAKAAAVPTTTLSHTPTVSPRPWFLRTAYYYETTKKVYKYTTAFPVISYLAQYGETTTNFFLSKLSIKSMSSTEDIDQSIVPLLQNVDDKCDERIAEVLHLLLRGQEAFLNKKNEAVHKVSNAAATTKSRVVSAKDSTYTTVSHVSSATYKKISGLTFGVLSYVPIIGKRFEA